MKVLSFVNKRDLIEDCRVWRGFNLFSINAQVKKARLTLENSQPPSLSNQTNVQINAMLRHSLHSADHDSAHILGQALVGREPVQA